MPDMVRTLALAVTGLSWAVMMSALVQNEVIPYFEYQAQPSYRTLLKDRPTREYYMRTIYMGNDLVGHSRTMVYPALNNTQQIMTRYEMSLSGLLQMMGMNKSLENAVDKISLVSRQSINAAYQLESFTMKGKVLLEVSVDGRRDGDQMKIHYNVANIKGTADLPFEKMSMMGGAYTPVQAIGKPAVGKQWKLQTLDVDIFSGKPRFVTVFARIEDKETIVYQGKKVEAFRIEFRKELKKELPLSRLWVDHTGEVLVEEVNVFNLSCRIVLEKKELATPEQVAQFVGRE
jgi:hypothetical protein